MNINFADFTVWERLEGGGITIKIGLRDWKVLNIKCNKI